MSRLLAPSLLTLALAACAPRTTAEGAPEPPPEVVLFGAKLESFEGERLAMSGEAARVSYQRSTGEVLATDATLRMPAGQRSPGTPPGFQGGLEVSAPNMDGNLASKQLVASGGVVVRTGEGLVARTPRMFYDVGTRRARGEEGVTVKGPDYRLRADRFELFLPEEKFTFDGSVETVLGATE